MNSKLTEGFYLVNEAGEVVSHKYGNILEAHSDALKSGFPVAILCVFEPFNNFAWGE